MPSVWLGDGKLKKNIDGKESGDLNVQKVYEVGCYESNFKLYL